MVLFEPFLGAVIDHYRIYINLNSHHLMQYRISFLIPFAVTIILGKWFQGIINSLFLMGAVYSLFFINWEQALAIYLLVVGHSLILTGLHNRNQRLELINQAARKILNEQ